MIDDAIAELIPILGSTRAACRAARSPRALSQVERDGVRALLNSPDFVDKAPATIYHELLDEGTYLCSVSSMCRILRAHEEVKERRRQPVQCCTRCASTRSSTTPTARTRAFGNARPLAPLPEPITDPDRLRT